MSSLKTLEIKLGAKQELTPKLFAKLPELLQRYMYTLLTDEQRALLQANYYSQYIIPLDENSHTLLWRINALNTWTVENVLGSVYEKITAPIHFDLYDLSLTILAKNYIHSATHRQLVEKYFRLNRQVNTVDFTLLTPTIFTKEVKDNILYLIQPKMIIEDLLIKWNYFAEDDYIDYKHNPKIISDLTKQLVLVNYNLNLQPYKKLIPSFKGEYKLYLNTNIMSKKLLCILTEYATFSGIGLNNHLGLGAVEVKLYNQRFKPQNLPSD